jgi:hypothetical protein
MNQETTNVFEYEADQKIFWHEKTRWLKWVSIMWVIFGIANLVESGHKRSLGAGLDAYFYLGMGIVFYPLRGSSMWKFMGPTVRISPEGIIVSEKIPRSLQWNDIDRNRSKLGKSVWVFRSKARPYIDPIKIYIKSYNKELDVKINKNLEAQPD